MVITTMGLLRRYCLNSKEKDLSTFIYLTHYNAYATLSFLAIYLGTWGFTWPDLLAGFFRAVALTITANLFIQLFNAKAAALAKGEVTLTAPLQAMTPGLITGMGLLFAEWPNRFGIAGVTCFAIASYLAGWNKKPPRWYYYFIPLQKLFLAFNWRNLSEDERSITKVVWFSFGSAACGTFGLLGDGLYARRGIDMQGLIFGSMLLTATLCISYLVWYIRRPDPSRGILAGLYAGFQKKYLWAIIAVGLAWVLHVIIIWPLFNHAFISYIGTLKRFSIILTVTMGYWIFKEENYNQGFFAVVLKKRFWIAILTVIGAFLISLDNLPLRITTHIEGWGF